MKSIITIALLLTMGQAVAGEQVISVQRDSVRGVTCWIVNNTGISCLPDNSLLPGPASTSTDEGQAARVSLTTSMRQNEQLPAIPTLRDERFQL